ncbi:glycosyltransferase family 2 protein [Clostridiisalibacter paucivorans]|uniref:glycosyltransferase family 2 protein n=1 Tax=Clostridiisalibacter paucivorans TaxID=408753 RepID=UPI000558D20D|nr:glycosyltransferase family 2 protein [Clostridiisalibacter paucivorans]
MKIKDVFLKPKPDRRILPNVPDAEKIRNNIDRRGSRKENSSVENAKKINEMGTRYLNTYKVQGTFIAKDKSIVNYTFNSVDISGTGILLEIDSEKQLETIKSAEKIKLKFEIIPGTMPEGYETKIDISSRFIRTVKSDDGKIYCGFEFSETLAEYINRKKDRYTLFMSSLLLLFISLVIVLMRTESIIYFKFNKYLYLYSIIAAVFLLSRYFIGTLYRSMKINPEFTPGVTIVIPCFNEEKWIENTIRSCMNQDYPIDKLEVIVVDDSSNDNSLERIRNIVERIHNEADRFKTKERLKYIAQEKNMGKREALSQGIRMSKHELLVFVDSDSFLDPFAIRNLVQPFQDPKMGGVSGRTDVANTYTNVLTKMQSVRYYIAFRIMKAAEAYFDTVTCLSGPLSCYRKDIIEENMDDWLNQKFLGQRATFGDDRSLTNFVLKNHRTSYQDTAVCSTIVPNTYKMFLKQQMRWKRSWLRESIIAAKYMWKKEPFASLFFYMGLIVPIAAPIIVLYNLIYVPIVYRFIPSTFLMGLLMMSLLMSFTQLLFRKSTTWVFGMFFCLYYEAVLLWQMPIAWVTFWKSTWGTRMTPEDIKEREKKEKKRKKKERAI